MTLSQRVMLLLILILGGVPSVCIQAADDSDQDKFAKQFEAARVHLQKGRTAEALEAYIELQDAQADATKVAIGISRVSESEGSLCCDAAG